MVIVIDSNFKNNKLMYSNIFLIKNINISKSIVNKLINDRSNYESVSMIEIDWRLIFTIFR